MSGPEHPDLSTEDWPDDERAAAPAPAAEPAPAPPAAEPADRGWARLVVPAGVAVAVAVVLARRRRR